MKEVQKGVVKVKPQIDKETFKELSKIKIIDADKIQQAMDQGMAEHDAGHVRFPRYQLARPDDRKEEE